MIPPALRRNRTGLTLIEVLVTLCIAGLLFAAIFRAVDLQVQWRARGEQIVERAQRDAACIADLTTDLRLVRAPLAATAAPQPPTAALTTPLGNTFQEQFLDVDPVHNLTPLRLWGTETLLALECAGSNPRFSEADSDRQVVVWTCRSGARWRVPLGRVDERLQMADAPPGDGHGHGLIRWSISVQQLQTNRAAWRALDLQTGVWHDVRPDLRAWRLRYYDGARWRSSWDADELQRLPHAVEVRWEGEVPAAPLVIRLSQAGGTS